MREIKFRGKEPKTGKWICGLLMNQEFGEHEHAGILGHPIDPNTLGQYTGLKDKNDTEIYEGDITEIKLAKRTSFLGIVEWRQDRCAFQIKSIPGQGGVGWWDTRYAHNAKIVGNIHDNPELLKEIQSHE